MRVLLEWRDHDRQSVLRSQPESDRRANPASDVGRPLPMPCARANDARDSAVCAGDKSMKIKNLVLALTPDASAALQKDGVSRRNFIKGSGALIVGFSMAGLGIRLNSSAASAAQRLDGASSNQLDAWIAIASDGSVTAYTGK